MVANSHNLRFIEDAEVQPEPCNFLVVLDFGLPKIAAATLEILPVKIEGSLFSNFGEALIEIKGNKEFKLVPEVQDGKEPLPFAR